MISQSARLGFEGHFFHSLPWQQPLHFGSEMPELIDRQVGRSASTEINEARLPRANEWLGGIIGKFLQGGIDIPANGRGIFIRVDLEIAEVTPFPAERNVEIDSEVCSGLRRALQSVVEFAYMVRLPKRERGIIRNEIVADRGFLLDRRGNRLLGNGFEVRAHRIAV